MKEILIFLFIMAPVISFQIYNSAVSNRRNNPIQGIHKRSTFVKLYHHSLIGETMKLYLCDTVEQAAWQAMPAILLALALGAGIPFLISITSREEEIETDLKNRKREN